MSPRFSIIKSSNTKSTAASKIKHTHTHTQHNSFAHHIHLSRFNSNAISLFGMGFAIFHSFGGCKFFSAALLFLSWEIRSVLVYLWNVGFLLRVARANCEHTKRTQLVFKDGESFLRFIVLAIKHTNVFVVCIFTIWIWRAQHGIIVWMFVCAVYIQIIFHCKQVETTNKSHSLCVCVRVGIFSSSFSSSLLSLLCLRLKTALSVELLIVCKHFCKAFRMCKRHVRRRRRRIVEHTNWHMSL